MLSVYVTAHKLRAHASRTFRAGARIQADQGIWDARASGIKCQHSDTQVEYAYCHAYRPYVTYTTLALVVGPSALVCFWGPNISCKYAL